MAKPTYLQRELESLRRVRHEQAEEIHRLRQEIRELRRRQGETDQVTDDPMKGLKLVVIGPSFRRQDYLAVLDPLGARVQIFASEEKISRITHSCRKAHGVIYINRQYRTRYVCSSAPSSMLGPLYRQSAKETPIERQSILK